MPPIDTKVSRKLDSSNKNQTISNYIKGCASEVGWKAGESPVRRIGLFTTEHDRNSAAARRGWKLREKNSRAVTTVNHI